MRLQWIVMAQLRIAWSCVQLQNALGSGTKEPFFWSFFLLVLKVYFSAGGAASPKTEWTILESVNTHMPPANSATNQDHHPLKHEQKNEESQQNQGRGLAHRNTQTWNTMCRRYSRPLSTQLMNVCLSLVAWVRVSQASSAQEFMVRLCFHCPPLVGAKSFRPNMENNIVPRPRRPGLVVFHWSNAQKPIANQGSWRSSVMTEEAHDGERTSLLPKRSARWHRANAASALAMVAVVCVAVAYLGDQGKQERTEMIACCSHMDDSCCHEGPQPWFPGAKVVNIDPKCESWFWFWSHCACIVYACANSCFSA